MLVPSDLGQEDTYSSQLLSHSPRVQGRSTEAVASVNTLCVKLCVHVGSESIAFIRLSELIHGKCLEWCVAHSRC